jgi:regulator of protease activity HflC (stomatin/prohibitin superfamily)
MMSCKNETKLIAAVQQIVDEISEPWGIDIERVEMKDVEIPTSYPAGYGQGSGSFARKRARLN